MLRHFITLVTAIIYTLPPHIPFYSHAGLYFAVFPCKYHINMQTYYSEWPQMQQMGELLKNAIPISSYNFPSDDPFSYTQNTTELNIHAINKLKFIWV
jgi:hypothetical protein